MKNIKKKISQIYPFIISFFLVLLFIYIWTNQNNHTIEKAHLEYDNGNFERAVELFNNEKSKLSNGDLFLLSNAYRLLKEYDKSLEVYNFLLSKNIKDNDLKGKIYINMANIYSENTDFKNALVYYNKAINSSEKNSNIQITAKRSMSYLISEIPTQETAKIGITLLLDLIEIPSQKDNPEHYFRLGKLINYIGDTEYAIKFWIQTLKIDHTYIQAYQQLGFSYLYKKEYDIAVSYFDKSISYKPNDYIAYFGKGQSLEYKGDIQESISYYRQAISLNNKDILSRFRLASIFLKNGDKTTAASLLYEIIQLEPDSIYANESEKILKEIIPKIYLPPDRLNGVNVDLNKE